MAVDQDVLQRIKEWLSEQGVHGQGPMMRSALWRQSCPGCPASNSNELKEVVDLGGGPPMIGAVCTRCGYIHHFLLERLKTLLRL